MKITFRRILILFLFAFVGCHVNLHEQKVFENIYSKPTITGKHMIIQKEPNGKNRVMVEKAVWLTSLRDSIITVVQVDDEADTNYFILDVHSNDGKGVAQYGPFSPIKYLSIYSLFYHPAVKTSAALSTHGSDRDARNF